MIHSILCIIDIFVYHESGSSRFSFVPPGFVKKSFEELEAQENGLESDCLLLGM